MKKIVIGKRSSVFYDEIKKEYTKTFNPKFKARLKYFLKLRKYPGLNFLHISKTLNSLGIKTPTITKVSKYSITTKELNGISLEHLLNDKNIEKKFITLIITLFRNKIYSGDLAPDNFIVVNNEIYALDLEDYKYEKFFYFNLKKALKRLKGKVPLEIYNSVYNYFK